MKALVIGLGSIGSRHAKNLLELGIEVAAIEPNKQMRVQDFQYVDSVADADADFAVVCSPTHLHLPHAIDVAKEGMHVLIEKPPSNTLQGFSELKKLCEKNKSIAMVACNFRFTHGLRAVKKIVGEKKYGRLLSARACFGQFLPSMRKSRDYKSLYAAGEAGGVMLDSFHEFDYVNWIMGSSPQEIAFFKTNTGLLEIAREDLVEVILDYRTALASIHCDYLRAKYARSCEFVFEKAVVNWDYRADEERELLQAFQDNGSKSALLDSKLVVNQMYLDELKHFIECIEENKQPTLGLTEAEDTLKLMLKVVNKS